MLFFSCVCDIINFSADVVEKLCNEVFYENFVRGAGSLSAIGDKFGYNPVVFSFAGFGTVLTKIIHFSVNSDKGSA